MDSRSIQVVELLSTIGYSLGDPSPIETIGALPHVYNYCPPLLSMYAKWCITICSAVGGRTVCPPPRVVAISYVYRNWRLEKIFLGASMAGRPAIVGCAAYSEEAPLCMTCGQIRQQRRRPCVMGLHASWTWGTARKHIRSICCPGRHLVYFQECCISSLYLRELYRARKFLYSLAYIGE
jgi:hypothetical protein